VSPIFIRPVREQLEHDRLIRFLQDKYKRRKVDVAINVGEDQAAPVKLGGHTFFPDLVLTEGKKLAGLVEVESGESVNNLEAMAQWVHFSRARVPFHLYVPVQGYDAARRLCAQNNASVSEIWTYRPAMEGFDLVRMFQDPSAVAAGAREARKAAAAAPPRPPAKPVPSAKPAAPPKPAATARPATPPKSAPPPVKAQNARKNHRNGKAVKTKPKTPSSKPPGNSKAVKPAKKAARPKKGAPSKR
jgi:hypothetical protein